MTMDGNIQDRMQRLYTLCVNIDNALLLGDAQALYDKVQEQSFYVVIVGLFKRGKSSLINALLGSMVTPVSVTPLTAVITYIRYGKESYAVVTFNDGHTTAISMDEIAEYVSEEANPKNIKDVGCVTIYHDAPLLKQLTLIDTPGLGSVNEHNTETTMSFIPKIDVAVLVLSADTPVSKADIEFLQAMNGKVSRFIFVLNKIDLLPVKEYSKLLEYNTGILAEALKKAPAHIVLYPVSTLETDGLNGLNGKLLSLSVSEKDNILQESTQRQLEGLKKQCIQFLQFRMDMLTQPSEELQKKLNHFSESVRTLTQDKGEFDSLLHFETEELGKIVHDTISSYAQVIESDLDSLIKELAAKEGADEKALNEKANKVIQEGFEQAKQEMEQKAIARFGDILNNYQNRGYFFLQEMTEKLSMFLNIDFNAITDRFDLKAYTSFYLKLSPAGMSGSVHTKWYSFLLGREARDRQRVKALKRHYHELVVSNSASIIYDLRYRIQESLRKFNYDLHASLEELLHAIEQEIKKTIENKNASFREVEEKVARQQELIWIAEKI